MHEVNLNSLDLNLLPPLEALLRLLNVSKAAAEVGLSQPAMSRTLARLRYVFDDPLLIRSGGGFGLTPRAHALIPRVQSALREVSGIFYEQAFNPLTVKRRIRIMASDVQTILIAPRLMARLAAEAPGLDLMFENYSPDHVVRLENGSLDLIFALADTSLPPGAVSVALAPDELALVVRRGHPAASRAWRIEDYGVYDHAGISIFGDGLSAIDAKLATYGVRRRMALVTPHFMAAISAVASSNLVTTVSRTFASKFLDQFDIVLKSPPFPNVLIQPILVSSELRKGDKLLDWLRTLIVDVSAKISATRLQL